MRTNKSFPVYPTGEERLVDGQGTAHYESPVLAAARNILYKQLHLTPAPSVGHTQPALTPTLLIRSEGTYQGHVGTERQREWSGGPA